MVKFLLVVIFMSGNGAGYKDFVGTFETLAECEASRKTFVAEAVRHFPKDTIFVATCAKPRPLHGIDV